MAGFRPLRVAVLLVLALVLGLAWPSWTRWQHRRTLRLAEAFLAKRDFTSASIAARQALKEAPEDVAAVELLARITSEAGSGDALLWCQRLVELRPQDPLPLLRLAQTAFALGETRMAEEALKALPAAAREGAEAQVLAGSLALAERDWDAAEKHFRAYARLRPDAPEAALNLAAVQVSRPRSETAAEGRAQLQKLSRQPETALGALRALLADARSRGDSAGALEVARELEKQPKATEDDRLRILEELLLVGGEALEEALTKAQTRVGGNALQAAILARWMNSRGLAPRAGQWLDQLAEAVRVQPVLLVLRVESAALQKDWGAVRARTGESSPDWGSFQFLKLAYGTRAAAMANAGRPANLQARWERAVHSTAGNALALSMLADLANGWGWQSDAVELWWLLARQPLGARAALQNLWRVAAKDRDTAALLRVARRVYELEPNNPVVINNLAWLLLLRNEDLALAHELAARNGAAHGEVAAFRSTAAYSLTVMGKVKEGAALLTGLEDPVWRTAAMQASAGVVLAAAGRGEEARPRLEQARSQANDLLPEEKAMVEKALLTL